MQSEELMLRLSEMDVIDLTLPLYEGCPTPYSWETLWDERDAGGPYGGTVVVAEHSGTHVDAPAHFVNGGAMVDELPLDLFFAPTAIIDVRDKTSADRDYKMNPDDIESWEGRYGRIPDGFFVFFWTGWDSLWGDGDPYLGMDEEGCYHFPGLDEAAAVMLSEERDVKGIGTDCNAIEPGLNITAGDFSTHHALLSRDMFIIEGLNNLSRLPPLGAFCIVLPLKLFKGTGSPARVLAFTEKGF